MNSRFAYEQILNGMLYATIIRENLVPGRNLHGGNCQMKPFTLISVLLGALIMVALLTPCAVGECVQDESITITIDRKTMPSSVLHPGRFFIKGETVTVHDFVIRDYFGIPIDGFVIRTSSGQTKVPVDQLEEIRLCRWPHRYSDDIKYIENVVEADMFLTDGTKMDVLMNADFGTIEGKTELGNFFLKDPHTVRRLVFNRSEQRDVSSSVSLETIPQVEKDQPEVPVQVAKRVPLDSDGDGVPDYKDECPNTPKGAPVNSVGCWTIRGALFDYNKWEIKPQYHYLMDENVRVLKMNPTLEIEIQGHTDSIASEEYNQILSEKRAESAKDYFVSKEVGEEKISTRGFGELKPIASNDTPEGRAKNRRIEIKIVNR